MIMIEFRVIVLEPTHVRKILFLSLNGFYVHLHALM
jgi:hypothetical protein